MKINWSLMNRLGLNEEADDFSGFAPSGAAGATEGGQNNDDINNDDADDDFDDDDDDDDLEDGADRSAQGAAKKVKTLPVQFDTEAMVRQIAEVTAQSMQQGGAQPLTAEEIQSRLGRPTVAAELVAQLRNPEVDAAQVAIALQKLQDDAYRYAMNTTSQLFQHHLSPLHEMQRQFAEQQRQHKEVTFKNNLSRAYPALKKYDTAVSQAMSELSAEGFSAKGLQPEQVYNVVARRAKKVINRILPDFKLKQSQTSNQHRQAGPFRSTRGGQGQAQPAQKYGADSFDLD